HLTSTEKAVSGLDASAARGGNPWSPLFATTLVSGLSQPVDPLAQHRHELPLEPGIMLDPRLITRRWVGQRHIVRSVRPPSPDCCGQRRLPAAAEKVTLGVLPDE